MNIDKRLEELAAREVPVHDREQALADALLRARKALGDEETVYVHVVGAEAWQMGKDPGAQRPCFDCTNGHPCDVWRELKMHAIKARRTALADPELAELLR